MWEKTMEKMDCYVLIFSWGIFGSYSKVNPTMYEAASKLVTEKLRDLPNGNSLHISPYVSSCFTYCFPSFFGYFPCFPWCFSLFPVLGFTHNDLLKPVESLSVIIRIDCFNIATVISSHSILLPCFIFPRPKKYRPVFIRMEM